MRRKNKGLFFHDRYEQIKGKIPWSWYVLIIGVIFVALAWVLPHSH